MDFTDLKKQYKVKVINLGISCIVCGHRWGIIVADFKSIEDIPLDKLICSSCYKKRLLEEQDME